MPTKCLGQLFAVQKVEISLVTRSNRRLGNAFNVLCGCGLMGNVTIALICTSMCMRC